MVFNHGCMFLEKVKYLILTYKVLFLVFIVIGAAGDMSSVWAFSDAMILSPCISKYDRFIYFISKG